MSVKATPAPEVASFPVILTIGSCRQLVSWDYQLWIAAKGGGKVWQSDGATRKCEAKSEPTTGSVAEAQSMSGKGRRNLMQKHLTLVYLECGGFDYENEIVFKDLICSTG